jgi:invasion protein IalB
MYIIEGREFEKMISSFKSGRELVYQFMSGDDPANKQVYRFSLMGFSEAYDLAKRCDSL